MKALVTYYSRTGTTEKLAKDLASRIGCDIDPIVSTEKWQGPMRWMACGKAGMKKELTKLEPPKMDPAQYDLVIIGATGYYRTCGRVHRRRFHDERSLCRRHGQLS